MKTLKSFISTSLISSFVILLGTSSHAEPPFSVNDLSILFPVTANGASPTLKVSVGDANWKLLSTVNFKSMIAAAELEGAYPDPAVKDPTKWFLYAIRYNPCTLFAGAAVACTEQMRFVFQNSDKQDRSIHVVYNFADRATPDLSPRLESFRKLKNQFAALTLDQPLAVSPILKSNQAKKYFAALQKEVVEPHLNHRFPTKITMMTLGKSSDGQENSDHWIFLTGNVDSLGQWKIAPLPVGAPAQSDHLVVNNDSMTLESTVDFKSFPQFNLFNKDSDPSSPVSTSNVQTAFQIFDQHQTNDHNVTCSSCHASDGRAFYGSLGEGSDIDRQAFVARTKALLHGKPRVTEVLLDDEVHAARDSNVEIPLFRMFGYFGERPAVSQRTALDAALATEQANQLYALQPQPQCANDPARDKLIECLFFAPFGSGPKVKECLQKSCP